MFESTSVNYPEVPALSGLSKKLMVMLHGLGSDGHDLISLVPYLQPSLPDCHFISPHAVEAYDMAPFGRQWFSIRDKSRKVIVSHLQKNIPLITNLISQKQKELSLGNKDTVLLGFSQGTMTAVYMTLVAAEPYAAVIGFSGRLIEPPELINKATPICLIHGVADEVVLCEDTENLAKYCAVNGIKCEKLLIDNLAHSIDGQGLEFAIKFLKKHLV